MRITAGKGSVMFFLTAMMPWHCCPIFAAEISFRLAGSLATAPLLFIGLPTCSSPHFSQLLTRTRRQNGLALLHPRKVTFKSTIVGKDLCVHWNYGLCQGLSVMRNGGLLIHSDSLDKTSDTGTSNCKLKVIPGMQKRTGILRYTKIT
jgi:hypothetical protein